MTATKKVRSEPQYETTKVGVHVGNMLMRAAGEYDNLLKTALEGVQNAIDARASVIFVGFDLKDRVSVLADNGEGATKEKFEQALATVGQSQKTRRRDALGQFGIGLISPLDKCEFFEFISRPGKRKEIRGWIFSQKHVHKSVEEPEIHTSVLPDMPSLEATFEPEAAKLGVAWNTIVRMYGITNDRVVSRLTTDKLASEIKSRFGHAMRARNATCYIFIRDEAGHLHRSKVEPLVYTGDPIEGSPFILNGSQTGKAGKVSIELYRAVEKNGKRRGSVEVSEGKGAVFGKKLSVFLDQARSQIGYDTKDSFEELNSGYFEGIIRAENLRLKPDRDSFEVDEAFFDLAVALDDWYDTVGRQYYEGEKDRTRNERYRDLTNHSIREVLEALKMQPDLDRFLAGIRENVELGRIGQRHGDKPNTGKDEDKSTRVKQKRQPKPGGCGGPSNSGGKGQTRDGDVPFGQIDQKGKQRALVKNDSTGLWIEVTEFELSSKLWHFDPTDGKLLFNCSNDVWADLDGATSDTRYQYQDGWIVHLQKWIITDVLTMLQLPRDRWEEFADERQNAARLYAQVVIKPNKSYLAKQ